MDNEQVLRSLRAEVKLLVVRGMIGPVPGVDDLSEDTLGALISEHKRSKLKAVNESICVTLVNGITSLCKTQKIMTDEGVDALRDGMLGDEGFMSVASDLIGKITPCIPYVGVVVGLGILGRYLYDGVVAVKKATEVPEPESEDI